MRLQQSRATTGDETTAAARVASIAFSAVLRVSVIGFSTNTCLPAFAAFTICFMCSECGVVTTTASISGSFSTLPYDETTLMPVYCENSFWLEGSREIAFTNWILLLPCTDSTRRLPHHPGP